MLEYHFDQSSFLAYRISKFRPRLQLFRLCILRHIPRSIPSMHIDPDETAVAARLLWIWTELEGQLGSPAGHPFYGDVVIVCVDCEGWQSNSHIRTSEIDVTLHDTRDLHDIPLDDWENQVHSFHFRTTELMNNRPERYAREN